MKERPILFSGPMVRAILEGRKTQTRRIMKPWNSLMVDSLGVDLYKGAIKPDYGVGDRLWVRETWARGFSYGGGTPQVFYRADNAAYIGDHIYPVCDVLAGKFGIMGGPPPHGQAPNNIKWRPSIHIPRWASRITLEVTGVRLERLQDISEEDAKAEGVIWSDGDTKGPFGTSSTKIVTARKEFYHLWDSLYAKRPGASWDDNPWVWVIEFTRVQ